MFKTFGRFSLSSQKKAYNVHYIGEVVPKIFSTFFAFCLVD